VTAAQQGAWRSVMEQTGSRDPDVVIAGHVCLDIIPEIAVRADDAAGFVAPGVLREVGPALLSTGGVVANTGLAMDRLGIPVRLVGKVGDDAFGRVVGSLLSQRAIRAVADLVVEPGATTSYSVVISMPGVDRTFLHHAGANDSFGAQDVEASALAGVRLFHFGYPPLMRRMYADDGAELARLLATVRRAGCTTSLDMARPDPSADSGRADWAAVLAAALPYTDVFVPSLDDLTAMLGDAAAGTLPGRGREPDTVPDPAGLGALADRLLALGAGAVMIKLGSHGAYLRTAGRERMARAGAAAPADPDAWADRELWSPCFAADAVGTTGAGDATAAGLLAGLLHGQGPEDALTSAVAVGGCSVEGADAVSGIRSWEATQSRVRAGWGRVALELPSPWRHDPTTGLWSGPRDAAAMTPR
jgi:sugar/nucleoside kinase (ribokinase family)